MGVAGQLAQKSVRVAKTYTKGYSSTQKKVRSATSNDLSPPTSREMNDIAVLSHQYVDFVEIIEVLDKRLNDRGKNWRHVFKALTVMEYLLLYGSSDVIKYCLDNLYEFKTLREFQYIDDNGIDQGHNVRQIAKAITNMLLSPSTIRSKRNGRGGRRSYDDLDTDRSRDGPSRGRPTGSGRSSSFDGDDSRREVVPRKRAVTESDATTSEDRDLLRAIELSKAEEEKRRKAVAAASSTVFNDFEQAKKDDPLIDLSDIQMSPPAPLQVQYTQLQPQYTVQPQFAVQPQYTSLPPQFTSLQPQYTPFQPQFTQGSMYDLQMQQEAMQAMYLRQQAEWSAAQAQAQAAAQQEEMSRQQQMLQYQHTQVPPVHSPPPQKPLAPQPTSFGSNNPFAAPSPSPSLSSSSSTSPSNASFTAPSTPYSARSLSRNAADERYAQLAHAYAGRAGDDSGVDTFGNTGLLRYGPTDTGRISAQKTGAFGNSFKTVYSQPTSPFGSR